MEKEFENLIKKANSIYTLFGDCKEFQDLQNQVISGQNPELIRLFAERVEGANVEKLQEALQETRNLKNLYEFAKNVKGADVAKICNVVAQDKFPIFDYLTRFAQLPGADINALAGAVIRMGNLDYIKTFSQFVDKEDVDTLYKICESVGYHAIKDNDAAVAYDFRKRVPQVYFRILVKAIIQIGDPRYLYLAAKLPEIEFVADLKAIQDAIINTADFEYIEKFAEEVEWADKIYIYKNLAKLYHDQLEGDKERI